MYFNSANFTILIKKIIYEVKSERFKTVILSAGIWGLITHGMMFFNKYSWHDDMSGFNSIGIMYGLGRWMSGIHGAIVSFMLGTRHVSIPVVNGMLTIIFIALSVFLIIVGLNIYHKLSIVLLTGMMISFPAVTGMFGYMNAAPYYYFGVFISVLAAYLFHNK